MLCGKACVFTRKDLARFSNEARELLYIVEREVHRVAGAIEFLSVCAHKAKESRYSSHGCK